MRDSRAETGARRRARVVAVQTADGGAARRGTAC